MAALEPPRPLHPMPARMYEAHRPVELAQRQGWAAGVGSVSAATHKVQFGILASSLQAGGEEPGAACREADSPLGLARITSCPTPAWLPLATC